jgi:hypothetical protein
MEVCVEARESSIYGLLPYLAAYGSNPPTPN